MSVEFQALVRMALSEPKRFQEYPLQEAISAARDYLQGRWKKIEARHRAGESGSNVVRLLTEAADEVVKGVVAFGIARDEHPKSLQGKVAICALGGYGRAEMNPRSDLDICLLYERKLNDSIKQLNEFLVPSLWDLGFQTGYTLHSIREAVDLARRDPEVYTTYAQARLLAGEAKVFAALRERMTAMRPKDKAGVLRYIRLREDAGKLPEAHQELYANEPNIKENLGGLRDFHTAFWILLMTQGPMVIDDLERLGYLSDEDYLDFIKAIDFLWRVRNELHFHTAKKEDQLTFPLQKHVATSFGYGEKSHKAIELFMQDYYGASQRVRWFLQTAVRICDEEMEAENTERSAPSRARITVYQGKLCFGNLDGKWFTESPARLMEVFWECSRRRVPLSYSAATWIRDNLHLVEDAFRSSDVVRRYFVAICSRPLSAGGALREAAQVGLLGAYLPEFAAIEGIVRYEDFHSYPVGEHTLRAVEALGAIDTAKGSVERLLEKVLEHVRNPHILVLAILFHDLGKVAGETHAEEGVRLAEQICARIGMPAEDTERIMFLVRHHMLMTNISFYRDLDDVDIVANFAKTMKSDERLRELLLLTYADLFAVGPSVWNEWKGALLLKLYLKAERILSGRPHVVEEEFWKSPKVDEIHAIATEYTRAQLESYLKGLGERYFIAFAPQHIAQHMRCLEEARSLGLSMHCSSNRETGMSEVVICTKDRHGLFAAITGSFTAQLVDVEGAAPFTTPDGYAVDCFTIKNAANDSPLSKSHFQAVRKLLNAVLLEEKDIQSHVDKARHRLFALLQPRVSAPTRIFFDNSSSATDTVIDIETGDRTGLLYDIGHALSEMGVEILSARIVTDARWVRDAFYVRLNEKKLDEKEIQAVIRAGLKKAIKPMPVAENKGVLA